MSKFKSLDTFAKDKGYTNGINDLATLSQEKQLEINKEYAASNEAAIHSLEQAVKEQGLALSKQSKTSLDVPKMSTPFSDINLNKEEVKKAIQGLKSDRANKSIGVTDNLNTGLLYSPTRNLVVTPETVNHVLTNSISWTAFNDVSFKWLSRTDDLKPEVVADCGVNAVPANETSFTLDVKNIETVKVKAIASVCDTFLSDVAIAADQLSNVMRRAVSAKVEQQLIQGLGNGAESESLTTYGTVFDGSGAAYADKIQNPILMDTLLAAAAEVGGASADVQSEKGYSANLALVSATDFFTLVTCAKATDNQYIDYRQTSIGMSGELLIGGLTVLPSSYVAPDTAFVLDTSVLFGVISADNRNVQLGYVDQNFYDDKVSFKLINRINLVCDDNDLRAIQKIESIATCIDNMKAA